MDLIDCAIPLRYHPLPWKLAPYLRDAALCNLNPARHTDLVAATLPQCLAMVELTLVGWKDPVVLDLPTTA